jgi:hypothetical protein
MVFSVFICLFIIVIPSEAKESKKRRRAASQRASYGSWSTIYGDATYSLELQGRHQKLLTRIVLISIAKMCN